MKYFSPTYGKTESAFATVDSDGNKTDGTAGGEIAVQLMAEDGSFYWQKLISSASYSSFDLKALVSPVKYDQFNKIFSVELRIMDKDTVIVTNTFQVMPVNTVKVNPD